MSWRLWMPACICLLSGCVTTPKAGPAELPAPLEPQSAAVAAEAPVRVRKPKRRKVIDTAPAPVVEADLWTRFARTRHWQPCVTDPGIERWISRYAGSPTRFATTLAPLVPLMDYVLTRSSALGLPSETMLVPIVESYYRPDARGPGGALGLWQLMPDTASRFGLVRRGPFDDRVDVRVSSDAALRLLVLNSEAFSKNPKLMFAAYNAGAYRVRKALGGREHSTVTSLAELGLSRTTQEYLDKLKALGCLLGEPARFSVELPTLAPEERLIEYRPPFVVDPRAVGERIGVSAANMKSWNAAAFARGAADPGFPLLIPQAKEGALIAALAAGTLTRHTPSPAAPVAAADKAIKGAGTAASPQRTHRVAAGDSLWEIAKRYRVRLADLIRWNHLNKRSMLRIGQRLRLHPG